VSRVAERKYAYDHDTGVVAQLTEKQIALVKSKYTEGSPFECWPWMGCKYPSGYGRFAPNGLKSILAHRLVWLISGRRIISGLVFDHKCRTRHCVNWNHLELVTPQQNTHRGIGPTAKLGLRTHCKNGHAFSGANTVIRRDGSRKCRACARRAVLANYYRHKAHDALVAALDGRGNPPKGGGE